MSDKRDLRTERLRNPGDDHVYVVIAERHTRGQQHDYSVRALTQCDLCRHTVVLSEESLAAVNRGVWPLCQECAASLAAEHGVEAFEIGHTTRDH